MITLQTGLPGHGKTLHCLWLLKRYLESENKRLQAEADKTGAVPMVRQVYYAGIKDLKLPWIEIDPVKWAECPPGSIIVIDECQNVFPGMPNGSKRPDFYAALAVHRHSGFDIFLITQDPSLIDNFVRKLVDRHIHSVRKFGFQRATVYEWSGVQQAPRSVAAIKSAVTKDWPYPKEVFTYYKSAEVHTVVRKVPGKLIVAVLFCLAMPFVLFAVFSAYTSKHVSQSSAALPAAGVLSSPGGVGPGDVSSQSGSKVSFDPVADARHFAYSNTPRVDGVAHTAPKYDDLTKPVRVPVPAMCIKKGSKCQCYSQSGSKMQLPYGACMDIAYNGFFEEFDRDSRASSVPSSPPPGAVAVPPPVPGPRSSEPPRVLVFDYPLEQKSPAAKK